ncbi:Uncharacterised protein [Serratia marcescens]|uniref:hypothetical protein n=1 Tax=Serratia marcescens TaxID=615 RepID=UPI00217855FF|nr:hypothetical protein [Serratia marcescens]CAI1534429.1 Uncharacterised protein [Serratia marcescens]
MYENIIIKKIMPWADHPVRQQRWHPMRTAILCRLGPTTPRRQLAKMLGVSENAIRQKADQLGITLFTRYVPYSKNDLKFMYENHKTLTLAEIADHLGRNKDALRHAMLLRGWATGKIAGEKHPMCKYPDSDVELCRALHDDGMAIPLIAEKMEVPYRTVRSWIQFESRKTTEGITHGKANHSLSPL